MNFIEQAKHLTTNKYFFYFILVLAGSNLLGYITENNLNGVIFFVMLSGIMYYLSKNLVLVLIVAIFGTSFLVSLLKNREGIENMDEESDMDKLENVDSDLKNGIDALKETDGDVSKAKEIIKKYNESKNKDNVVYPVQEQKDAEIEDTNVTGSDEYSNTDFEPFSTYNQTSSSNYLDKAAFLDQNYDNLGENINEKLKQESKYLNLHKINIENSLSNMKPMLETTGNMITGIDIVKYGGSIVEGASEFLSGLL